MLAHLKQQLIMLVSSVPFLFLATTDLLIHYITPLAISNRGIKHPDSYVGLRQWSALSPLLFIAVVELISRKIGTKEF